MNVSRKERRRKRRWYSLVIAWILLGPFLHTYCVLLRTHAYAYEWPDGDRDKLLIRLVFPRTLSMEGEGRISLLSRCRQEIRG